MTDTVSRGTALVTGASSGLGRVYARRLAARGYDLILAARDGRRMEVLADEIRTDTGRSVDILVVDLTDDTDVDAVVARIREDEAITLLVNNAGMSLTDGILENGATELRRIIALNITAATLLAAAAAQSFPGRQAPGIVNIASVLALMPERFDGVYSGTKAFVLNLSQSLAIQLEGKVRVQAVLPGATRTEIWERSGKDVDAFPPEMVMAADDLVDAALTGYDRGEVVTIPPLADEGQWTAFEAARAAMAPNLSRREVAPRYGLAQADA